MTALIALPASKFQAKQRKWVICSLTRKIYKLAIRADKHKTDCDEEKLWKFWTSWPTEKVNGATLFGLFFRQKEVQQ